MLSKKESLDTIFQKAIVFAIISLFIMVLTVALVININLQWSALLIGGGLMLATIPVHFKGRKNTNLYPISYCLNVISTGFSIAAYYTIRNVPFNYIQVLVATATISLLLLLSALLLRQEESKGTSFAAINIISGSALIILALLWLTYETTTLYSLSFFLLVYSLFYIFLFKEINNQTNIFHKLSSYSYTLYLAITVLVLAIISEGDLPFDLDLPERKRKKI
jgi:hypothetical protein